jgi:hypothetical protein
MYNYYFKYGFIHNLYTVKINFISLIFVRDQLIIWEDNKIRGGYGRIRESIFY